MLDPESSEAGSESAPTPRRRRAGRPAGPPDPVEQSTNDTVIEQPTTEDKPAPARRTRTRKPAAASVTAEATEAPVVDSASAPAPEQADVTPPSTPTRRRRTRTPAATATTPSASNSPTAEPVAADVAPIDTTATETVTPDTTAPTTDSVEAPTAPVRRTRRRATRAAGDTTSRAQSSDKTATPDGDTAASASDDNDGSVAGALSELVAAVAAQESPEPASTTSPVADQEADADAQAPSSEPEPVVAAETDAVEEETDDVAAALTAAAATRRRRPVSRRVARPFDVVAEPDETGVVTPEAVLEGLADAISADSDDRPVPAQDSDEDDDDTVDDSSQDGADDDSDVDESSSPRRRRRRGGRRRRRSSTSSEDDSTDEEPSAEEAPAETNDDSAATDTAEDSTDPTADGEEQSTTRRRRRRRRRSDGAESGDPGRPARQGADPADEVTGISGSTRMEAKRQRRKEGRAAGRRRTPMLSEAEFLARRESVKRTMLIRQSDEYSQIAVLEDNMLVEHYVDRPSATSLIGNIYLGRVQNVLPSMEAAFIDIGRARNAVLYAGEVDWDSFGADGESKRIEKVFKSGQSVLVQVTKDPVGAKGARLTSQISLPGRFIVYSPGGHLSGISRKLPVAERERLKELLGNHIGDKASFIVRTAAEGADEDELVRDVHRLQAQWEVIEKKGAKGPAPQLLYAEPDLTLRIVRDLFTEDFSEVIIDGNGSPDDAFDSVEGYVRHVAPVLAERVTRWDRSVGDIFAKNRVDEQIAKALERKVFLPSGGSLIIDRTEAMTVIDVNTGKFTGTGGNLEATVTSNNLEAADEIVRQLRLRDIGGIIVIDFIDMVLPSNRELLLRRLVECLGRDRTRHQVAEVTSLGLVQMTRKKIGTGLAEAFTVSCETCQGRGYHRHDQPVSDQAPPDGGERHHKGNKGGSNKSNKGKDGKAKDSKSKSKGSGSKDSSSRGSRNGNGAGASTADAPADPASQVAAVQSPATIDNGGAPDTAAVPQPA